MQIKHNILKYNKIIIFGYSLVLAFLFNTHPSFLLCEEEILDNNNIKENTLYNYFYYTSLILVATIFIYSLTISLYPNLDFFNLLSASPENSIDFVSRYGLQTLSQDSIETNNIFMHYVDPVIHERLASALERSIQQNKLLVEQNMILINQIGHYQRQIENLFIGFDLKSNLSSFQENPIDKTSP